MTSLARIVDEKGCLLPPEQCNIKPLECLTKDRAKSPSRRSPSRNGKSNSGNERDTPPKLPTFVQDVSKTKTIHLTSPTAVKGSTNLATQENTTNSYPRDFPGGDEKLKQSSKSPSYSGREKQSGSECDVKTKTKKMKSGEEDAQLPGKPIALWTKEDVSLWLDYVDLKYLKENFISHNVTGKTLLNLNYKTLVELDFSSSSEERENFFAAVYELQQHEHDADDDKEMDKEIEETLKGDSEHVVNHKQTPHSQMTSDLTSSESFASSSRTESEHGNTPTVEDNTRKAQQEIVTQSKHASNNTQHKSSTIPSKKESPSKTKKESAKHGEKKTKSKGKRMSRFWSSFQGNKSSQVIDTVPSGPFYKNVFHNLMDSGPQGVIKVWTEMFLTDMQYVSLLVRYETTAFETIKMVLEKSNAHEDPETYRICEIDEKNNEYILHKDESPLQRERQWADPDNCRFELRWRNERLIEWGSISGPSGQDLSLQKTDKDSKGPKNVANGTEDVDQESLSSPTSPESDDSRTFLETEFDYNVEVEYKTDSKEQEDNLVFNAAPKEMTSGEDTTTTTANRIKTGAIPKKVEGENNNEISENEPGSLLRAHKQKLTSSCPDLTRQDLFEMNGEVRGSPTSERSGDERSTTPDEEFEYSEQLRRSSKKLSGRLKLKTEKTVEDGQIGVQTNVNGDSREHEVSPAGDVTDGIQGPHISSVNGVDQLMQLSNNHHVTESNETPSEVLIGDHKGTVGEMCEVKVLLGEPNIPTNELSKETGEKSSQDVIHSEPSPDVKKLLERMKELESENSVLVEDNRELKKSCRTFEGRSRLKEREMEELEEEKNELGVQMQEVVDDLHTMRAENAELRASLLEAKNKLSDVDGWVTREVFENIRGQLSLSLEEVETKEEELLEVKKNMLVVKEENKKIKVLETEVETLNQRIKEDRDTMEGMKKDAKDNVRQIQGFEAEIEKLRASVKKREEEKQELVKKLEETETEKGDEIRKHAEAKKDSQKRLSDKDYEILIMKEEKKELCVKLKGLENNIENLQEELKKKDKEHEEVIAEMKEQNDIKDESLSVTVSNLQELVNERDERIRQLKDQIKDQKKRSETESQAKEHEYEQKKVYLKHLIALVRKKHPKLLDDLNRTLSSRDPDDWC